MTKQRHFKSFNHTVFKLAFMCGVFAMISVNRDSHADTFTPTDPFKKNALTTDTLVTDSNIVADKNIMLIHEGIQNSEVQIEQLNELSEENGIVSPELLDMPDVPLNAISPDTLKTFVKVIDIARREYIDPINDEQLFVNSMQGMLKNLDPYAEFLDSQRYESLKLFTQGDVAQVGMTAVFNQKLKYWTIDSIEKDSPAADAGIEVGFYVHQIDGVKLNQRTDIRDVEQLLRGMAGSMVEVVTSNKGRRKQKHTLQRNLMTEQSVKVVVKNGIAIVSIPVFQENTKSQILDGLIALQEPIIGVLLDLRDNPGGVLDSAVEISSLFQADADVVKIEYRNGTQKLLKTQGNSQLKESPVIILQNRYSASAAEVLASSLQHTGRSKVVGEASYGKGTVQSVIPINDNQAIKLTIAKYLQADGKQINGIGVIPNIEFKGGDGVTSSVSDTVNTTRPTPFNNLNVRVNTMIYAGNDSNVYANKHQGFTNNQPDLLFVSPEGLAMSNVQDNQKDWQTQAVDILMNDINELAKKKGVAPKSMKITSLTGE